MHLTFCWKFDEECINQGSTCPDGGLGEQPSSGHGRPGPSASSPVEFSVPLAGNGYPRPGQTGRTPWHGGSRSWVSLTSVRRHLVKARAEWSAGKQSSPRMGSFILNVNRRRTAVARPVPWTGEYSRANDQGVRSPIVTPGHMVNIIPMPRKLLPPWMPPIFSMWRYSHWLSGRRPRTATPCDPHPALPCPSHRGNGWPEPANSRNCRLP